MDGIGKEQLMNRTVLRLRLRSLPYLLLILLVLVNVPVLLCTTTGSDNSDKDTFTFNDAEDLSPGDKEDSETGTAKKNLTLAIGQIKKNLIPSDTCREAVQKFGESVSNFTLCSVTNARPIRLCVLCVQYYLSVLAMHEEFIDTIDEHGTECSEYYLNLDRIEIVSAAYHYVKSLWKKGNCNYCFEKGPDGGPSQIQTNDTIRFEKAYDDVRDCFDAMGNDSCSNCTEYYKDLNNIYVIIGDTCDGNICLDIVDTMNTTRERWSQILLCTPVRQLEFGIIFGISFVAIIPILFYPLAFILSKKQERNVLHQKRLAEAEVFGSQSHNSQQTQSTSNIVSIRNLLATPTNEIAGSLISTTSSQYRRRATVAF